MTEASRHIRCALVALLLSSMAYTQDCKLPILSAFSNQTSESIELEWLDFNQNAISWDIEYGLAGFVVSGQATISAIAQKTTEINDLESGSTYEFYIRANCDSGMSSGWNGPYFSNTAIDNENSCGLNFEISDNNCPGNDIFKIEISDFPDAALGSDLVLENVDLIIEHPWPPDLRLQLSSPQGQVIRLSTNNGSGLDNYGNPSENNCIAPLQFTDNGCERIDKIAPPFIGQFKPEEPLSTFYTGSSPDGVWELGICDHANIDIGFLKYVRLNFSEMACIVPSSFSVIDIEADNVTVGWNNDFGCSALEIIYKKANAPVQQSFAEYAVCNLNSFTLLDLEPDTDYELVVRADCGGAIFSPESCLITFRTACQNSSIVENFDELTSCILSCNSDCGINSIWVNSVQNKSDWLLNSGPTPTSFTGPNEDVQRNGLYLYIENQDNICAEALDIYLESLCLTKPDNGSCALSFAYHMFGQDIGTLAVEYSIDEKSWEELWRLQGNQEEAWKTASVELPTQFERGKIRFRASKKENSVRGDLALDNIKLIGIDTIAPLLLYADQDNDGYGNLDKPILSCSNLPLIGYVTNSDDCDDTSASVFPGAVEIKCNQIDENCNGQEDDTDPDQISYTVGIVRGESCKGSADGFATVQGVDGQEPYSYAWSNGETGQGVTDLLSGIYYCTISDVGGCQVVSNPIVVGFEDILVYSIRSKVNPSCFGDSDGEIEILIEGGIPPYIVEWNNGRRGSFVNRLSDGKYFATISDNSDCNVIIDSIILEGTQILTTGVQSLDADCYGKSTGFLRLGILGGNPPYDILWSTGASESFLNNLSAGNYAVTVTDQNGCYNVLDDIVVSEPDSLELSLVSIESISCPGESNSLVDINVKGGTPPYAYFWSDGSNGQDLINKPAGTYSVTVSDFNSCSTELNDIEVSEPAKLDITVTRLENVRCSGSLEGSIEVAVSGGTQPYYYNWGIADGEVSDENFLENLSFGNYSLTVVDAFNCKSEAVTVSVVNNAIPLQVQLSALAPIQCFGDSSGVVLAEVGAAQLPLDFNWSSGSNVQGMTFLDTISELISDTYNLTVTDNEGCVGISDSLSLSQPSEIQYTLSSLIDNICSVDSNGFIELSIVGGLPPYELSWSDGGAGLIRTGLVDGIYSASISDRKDCRTEVMAIEIQSDSDIELETQVVHPTESSLGSIFINPSGGLAPYSFKWSNPIQFLSGPEAQELEVGFYEVTVMDGNDCSKDTLIELKLSTAATQPISEQKFKIYPNPTNGILYTELGTSSVSIIEASGRVVKKINFHNPISAKQIDLTDLLDGIYLLRFDLSDNVFAAKIALVR